MRGARQKGFPKFWLLALGLVLLFFWEAQATSNSLELRPSKIEIGSFFQGVDLQVTAVIPVTDEAVLEVWGPIREEHFARKSRRLGLWMNTGDLTVKGVPSLYFCQATNPALVLQTAAPWGYDSWRRECYILGTKQPEEEESIFRQLLLLKESEGVFKVNTAPLEVQLEPTLVKKISAVFHLPAQICPGLYQVRLYLLGENGQISKEERSFQVVKVGMPRWVSALAFEQPFLYGIAAVTIALVAGLAIGLIFRSKGAH